MRAEIIAIGSELVSGQRLDTNSQWLSQRLGSLGVPVGYHSSVGDDMEDCEAAIRLAAARSGLVVVSGGLGPTQDDLTREALARASGAALIEDPGSLAAIEAFFARRNRAMPERNRVQALIPKGALALPNRTGTAPGLWMLVGQSLVACLPGVPSELKSMFQEQVVPRLQGLGFGTGVIMHRVVHLFGLGESEIEARALDLTARGRQPEVGITASDATISFRISCAAETESEAEARIEPTLALIRERFMSLVVSESEQEELAHALVGQLVRAGATLAVAESCTGGLIAQRITAIPDVSPVFLGGIVAYANRVKEAQLGVPGELLGAHGAVSPEVAIAMADGVRERFGATIGLAVTGIAGPSGGSAEKPVGLVFLGLSMPGGAASARLELGPEQPRDIIQSRAAKHAMNWARLSLLAGARNAVPYPPRP